MSKKDFLNNLYDLIKVNALPKSQNDDWAELSRKHGNEAKKEIGKFIRNKAISVDDHEIKIGRGITLTIS